MQYITFPWEQLGGLLRKLSLSGNIGNWAAWIIFLLTGAIPLAGIYFLRRRQRAFRADILLLPLSATLYIGLWFFVNPSYMDRYLSPIPTGGFAKYALAAVIDSLLLTWLLLRCMLHCEAMEGQKLLTCLRLLLMLYAVVTALNILLQGGSDFLAECTAMGERNSGADKFTLSVSALFLALQAVTALLPSMTKLALLLMLSSFLRSCEKENFGEEACAKMERLKLSSGRFLTLILVATVSCNVLQLLFSRVLLSIRHQLLFPLSELIAVLGIRILSMFYLESRRLKEDNDMFI